MPQIFAGMPFIWYSPEKTEKNVYPVSLKAPVILKNKVEKYARKGLSYWRAHGTEAFVSKTAGKLRSLKERPIEYGKWFRLHAADKKELERERKQFLIISR